VKLPSPRPGLVIRYAFLWSHQRDAGADEASKDRPCAIVVAASRQPDAETRVVVAPITHSAPAEPDASIEIHVSVVRRLGLDAGRHWIRFEELNSFVWPGFDLRPIPGREGEVDYGLLPREVFEALRRGILTRQAARRVRVVQRE
jgi:hypothetical protein